jgi:hypothetical protein
MSATLERLEKKRAELEAKQKVLGQQVPLAFFPATVVHSFFFVWLWQGDGGRRCTKGCHKFLNDPLFKVHDPKHPEDGKHKCPKDKDGSALVCKSFADCDYLRGHPEEMLRRQQEKTDRLIDQEKEKQKLLEAKLKSKVRKSGCHLFVLFFVLFIFLLRVNFVQSKAEFKAPASEFLKDFG